MMSSETLIEVSVPHLILAIAPLLGLAWISWDLDLKLESPILVATFRTFFQLTILGFILDPIFEWGIKLWWLVLGYVMLMILLASSEASARTKYYFPGMFWYILGALTINVAFVSLFAFGIILQTHPLWDPQYVIPIVGMLLGNSMTGVSLSLNAMLTSIVESSREIELLLCFGATSYEASARLLREAVRTGTMPQLNSMAIIGLISIPGMMTGQILGGSSVMEAARYQILIMYLIAVCSFGTILTETFLVLRVCFDSNTVLRTDKLQKREKKPSMLDCLGACYRKIICCLKNPTAVGRRSSSFSIPLDETSYLAPMGKLTVTTSPAVEGDVTNRDRFLVSVSGLSYSYYKGGELTPEDKNDMSTEGELEDQARRILFQNVSFKMISGGRAIVSGPSGTGKSTMLKILAGLIPADEGKVLLQGKSMVFYRNEMNAWRKQVLYVPQTKVDIPGTPYELIKKIVSFSVWNDKHELSPSYEDMKQSTRTLIQNWGMSPSLLGSEWTTLSGGESQRMLLALALASKPKVILLDESTSALDLESKVRVEASVAEYCKQFGMSAIWITHDQAQKTRMQAV